jgi:uncharacterized protein
VARTKVTLPRAVLGMVLAAGLVAAGRFVVRLVGMERGEGDAAGRPFGALRGHTYVSLTTFRENGEAVPTPVWFAISDDRIYVGTDPESGKMKRIRNNPRVLLTVCDPWGRTRGESVEGVARPLEGEAPDVAWRALFGKYRLELGAAHLFGALPWYRPTLEIRPAEPST